MSIRRIVSLLRILGGSAALILVMGYQPDSLLLMGVIAFLGGLLIGPWVALAVPGWLGLITILIMASTSDSASTDYVEAPPWIVLVALYVVWPYLAAVAGGVCSRMLPRLRHAAVHVRRNVAPEKHLRPFGPDRPRLS